MKTYCIRDWGHLFENNRTRELKKLDWVPLPNKQDGDGYTAVLSLPNGPAIFGAWVACVQIASRCEPRGTLMRDCKKPHDANSLSRMSRFPAALIQEMLDALSNDEINWLIVNESTNPAAGCDTSASECGNTAAGCLEGKGREGNGSGGNVSIPPRQISRLNDFSKITEDDSRKWLADWKSNGADYTEEERHSAFLALQANGWMWGRNPVTDPRAALERQIQTDRDRKSKQSGNPVSAQPVWAQVNALKKAIEVHPSNPEFVGHVAGNADGWKDYTAKLKKLKELETQ